MKVHFLDTHMFGLPSGEGEGEREGEGEGRRRLCEDKPQSISSVGQKCCHDFHKGRNETLRTFSRTVRGERVAREVGEVA